MAKKLHIHSYKPNPGISLTLENKRKRLEGFSGLVRVFEVNPDFHQNILFSDECMFYIEGWANRQIER